MSLPDKLKYARQRAQLNGAQVKERAGIGESSLSEFENGKREPSLSQLSSLSRVYRRPVSFFLSHEPLPCDIVLWRERPEEGIGDIETEFLRLCEQYHNLELWTDEDPTISLPEARGDAQTYGYADAEALAKRVRDELQLGDRPAKVLLSVLEEVCGIKIFHLDFQPSGTAACAMSDTFGAAILLNSCNVRWRRNFDLAHELFHLLTWQLFRSGVTSDVHVGDAWTQEEKLATCFARNLLMPVEAIRTAVDTRTENGKISFEVLFDIARQFDVSVRALLWQMHFLYGWKDELKTKQKIEKAEALAHTFQVREQETPQVWPARYHALAVKALRRGEISIGRFAEYLQISRQEAMKFVEQEVADAEEVQISISG